MGNAVLPLGPCWSLEQVDGPWFEAQRGALPGGAGPASQSEKAGGTERDAQDITEHSLVAVPADCRTGRVLRDQGLAQSLRGKAGEGRDALAQREQDGWDGWCVPECLAFEVVGLAEGDDTPLPDMAVEHEGF